MTTDRRLNRKLPERVRREDTPGIRIDSGPFIGIIKNNIDPTRAGRLQVWIPDLGGDEDNPQNWRTVNYASPFYGTTYQPNTSKNNKYDEVQHSYGMWAVIPDIGNQVICTFIAGDPNRGYWFACINPNLSHHMVPALGSTKTLDTNNIDPALKSKFDTNSSVWPAAEFNENIPDNIKPGWINNPKPPHEFQANVLINQGLDRDGVRGAIGSSAQRESPSNVFGISTPGRPLNDPMDNPQFEAKLKAGTLTEADYAVRGRKGGHTFVMDDGEQMGANQLVRLRTAGGHQILMNDSDRIVYIANSDGSVWLEFTGGGHINLYSAAGINVRTEGEFNVHADKDININSGGSIKLKSENVIANQTKDFYIKSSTSTSIHTGKFGALVDGSLTLQSASGGWNSSGKLVLKGSKILLNTETPPEVPKVSDLKTYKQADTGWDSTKGLWVSKSDVYETIATISPAHEPWPRTAGRGVAAVKSQFSEAPKVEKQSSVCEAPGGVTAIKPGILPTGTTGEELIVSALQQAGKTDPITVAAILAQCAHESGNFTKLVENLNYSAEGLNRTFRKYFPTLESAAPYARNPEKIANKVYGGRMGNGPETSGDGWKFIGRGYIGLTGRELYTKASSKIGVDLVNNPEQASDPKIAARLVVYFFFENDGRFNTVNWDDVDRISYLVNGGDNGLADRREKYKAYKAKYASGNVVTTGTGGVVVDGSGRPITTGSGALDPGPESAKGKAVVKPAPGEKMGAADAPRPAPIASTESKIPGLIATQVKALMIQIGYAESDLNYSAQDVTLGRIGRYKINGNLLRDYGYIKSDYLSKYGTAAIFRDDSWTGKDGITGPSDFTSGKGIQDSLMETVINDYYKALVRNRGIQIQDDVCTVAGMISVAYFLRDSERGFLSGNPPDQAKFWREQANTITNKQKETCDTAYNQGRYAIDVLSIQTTGPTTTLSDAVVTLGPSGSGINPLDVIQFTSGSGDYDHYMQMPADLRAKFESLASEYKQLTGKKLMLSSSYRSVEEQTALYQRWVSLGGNIPGNPVVQDETGSKIFMPSKPSASSPHARRLAFDLSKTDIAFLESKGLLAKYNFLFPFPINDPVHIQTRG